VRALRVIRGRFNHWCFAAFTIVISVLPCDLVLMAQRWRPTAWVGNIQTSFNASRTVAVITIDLEGGRFGETPGSAPDGFTDWLFVLTQIAQAPPPMRGRATLRMTDGSATFLDFLELSVAGQRPITIRAEVAPESPSSSTAFIRACRIVRLFAAPEVNETHEQATPRIMTVRWNDSSYLGKSPC